MTDSLNRIRSAIATSPFKKVLLSPPVRRAGAAVLALRFLPSVWALERPTAFLAAEVLRSKTKEYRVQNSDVKLVVRHDSGALELVHEVFGARCYDPDAYCRARIPTPPTVLDLGANVGAFSAFVLSQWPAARITCLEPDPDNLAALNRFRELHQMADVTIVAACACTTDGTVAFQSGGGAGSHVSDQGTPTLAVDVFPLMAQADFVKIDIEGSEWPILRDPRLSALSKLVVVMEYHRRSWDDSGAEHEARRLLELAGFIVVRTEPNYWGHGLMWAIKE